MKKHNYKMNISQAEFFNILGNHTLKDMPLSNLNRNAASDTTLYGSVNGKSAKLCPHPADKYKPFNPINEITAEECGTQLDVCVKSYTNKKDIIFWIGYGFNLPCPFPKLSRNLYRTAVYMVFARIRYNCCFTVIRLYDKKQQKCFL